MIGALSILERQPCLIAVVNDGSELDLVMVEPLQFVDADVIYTIGAAMGFRPFAEHPLHFLPSTQEGR